MFQINFRSCNSSRPIRATLLKVVLSLSLSALLLISSPGLVLAEGETPPIPTESAPETSAGDDQDSSSSPPPTTEASKPFATEAAESDPNSQIVTDPVNESMTESTEPSASVTEVPDNAGTPSEVGSDSPPASEVVTQIEQAVLIPPLPDDVNLQVLDEVGQPLPLVTIVAAEILAAPDPFFTRGGTLVRYAADCTGLANCTVSAAPIQAAIDDVKTNGIPDDSTINVEAGTYNENVVIDNLGALQPLTLKGGVGGGTSTINGTLYIHDNIAVIEVNGFTITGGVSGNDNGGEVALKNLTITGNAASLGNGAAGIAFIDSSSFILDNVNSSNIPVVGGSGYGLAMNNINGAVEVENSTFDDNPDIGLLISDHIGTITITNVAASNNDGTGAYLHNPTSGDVSVSGSTFSGNGAGGGIYMDGLDVITSGSITLQNVTASNNANYGAYLDNCGWNGATCAGAGTGDVSVDPSTFSNNGSEGLVVHSADDIVVDQVTADNNWGSNVWLVTKNGAGAINITNSIFQGSPVALNCTTAERIAVTAGGVLVQINCTTSGGGGSVSSESSNEKGIQESSKTPVSPQFTSGTTLITSYKVLAQNVALRIMEVLLAGGTGRINDKVQLSLMSASIEQAVLEALNLSSMRFGGETLDGFGNGWLTELGLQPTSTSAAVPGPSGGEVVQHALTNNRRGQNMSGGNHTTSSASGDYTDNHGNQSIWEIVVDYDHDSGETTVIVSEHESHNGETTKETETITVYGSDGKVKESETHDFNDDPDTTNGEGGNNGGSSGGGAGGENCDEENCDGDNGSGGSGYCAGDDIGCSEGTGGGPGTDRARADNILKSGFGSGEGGQPCADDALNCAPEGLLGGSGYKFAGEPSDAGWGNGCQDDGNRCLPQGFQIPLSGNPSCPPEDPCGDEGL